MLVVDKLIKCFSVLGIMIVLRTSYNVSKIGIDSNCYSRHRVVDLLGSIMSSNLPFKFAIILPLPVVLINNGTVGIVGFGTYRQWNGYDLELWVFISLNRSNFPRRS